MFVVTRLEAFRIALKNPRIELLAHGHTASSKCFSSDDSQPSSKAICVVQVSKPSIRPCVAKRRNRCSITCQASSSSRVPGFDLTSAFGDRSGGQSVRADVGAGSLAAWHRLTQRMVGGDLPEMIRIIGIDD
jgi:hypothetical protein